jgi:acetylornithine aminotransferase
MPLFPVYTLYPITIEHARGSWVWDNHGQRYLDMYGGHAVISIGHSHPEYISKVTDQLQRIGFYSNSVVIPQQEMLATLLEEIGGKKNFQLFLCNSGAEANENALKLASFHTGRRKIVAFSGAFHGRTSLAVALTDNPALLAPVNETPNAIKLPFNDVEQLEAYFKKEGDAVAGVIVEGIQGVGGIQEASVEFLQSIRRLCDQYGAVYIADGVQCGYGRTGQFFSHDHAGVDADIYTMAKGMGNGFPVAGVLIAPHIQGKPGLLGTTFGGNHLACVAAIAVLEVMKHEKLQENAIKEGERLRFALKQIPGISGVRGRGLMIGFDAPSIPDLRKHLLLHQKVFTGEAKPATIRLLPSMAIQTEEVETFIHLLQDSVATLLPDNFTP